LFTRSARSFYASSLSLVLHFISGLLQVPSMLIINKGSLILLNIEYKLVLELANT